MIKTNPHNRSLIQLQPDIITSRVAGLLQAEAAKMASINLSTSSNALEVRKGNSSRSRGTQAPWLRWERYSLLLGRAWEFEISKSQQGWKFSMCIYAIVSPKSLVVRYTSEGNLDGLKELFSLGEASPFTICMGSEPIGSSHFSRPLLRVRKAFPVYIHELMGTDRGGGWKLRTLRILDQSRC